MYDADIKIDKNTTAFLVGSIREDIGLCASNSKPLISKKSTITRASVFIADWLGIGTEDWIVSVYGYGESLIDFV